MGFYDDWAPRGIDTHTPSTARMYDYFLGGKDNFPADREAAEKVLKLVPAVREHAVLNRQFLGRVVAYMAEQGVRQFLDIGTGIPSQDNTHQVALRANPDARVAYVDNDPIVLAHARALLSDGDTDTHVAVIDADMHDPRSLMADPKLREHLDFTEPVGVLFIAVLHFAQEPGRIVDEVRRHLPAGSYLAVSHATTEADPEHLQDAVNMYRQSGSDIFTRSRAEVRDVLEGFDLVDPGVTAIASWRGPGETIPDDPDTLLIGGVGIKP